MNQGENLRTFVGMILPVVLILLSASVVFSHDAPLLVRTDSTSYHVNTEVAQRMLVYGDATFHLRLSLLGRDQDIVLHRTNLIPVTAQITRMTSHGPVRVDPRSIATYRGTLPDDPTSTVSVVLTNDAMVGSIQTRTHRMRITSEGANDVQVTTMPLASLTRGPSCHTPEDASPEVLAAIRRAATSKNAEGTQSTDTLTTELAIEGDYALYTGMDKNMGKALAYIANLYAVASQVYERELQTRFVLNSIRVWETAADPYPDNVPVFQVLEPFKAYYFPAMDSVKRDVVVFMTMRGGQGGVASSIGGLCQGSASCVCIDVTGAVAPFPTYAWDTELVVHEIGHVCGGLHTQSCIWPGGPLDSCIASEDGTCVPWNKTRPIIGTIMSYCHQRASDGGGIALVFHPRHRTVLRSFIEASSCIGKRPAPGTAVVQGRLLHATTKQPLAGVRLSVSPYQDDVVPPGPAVGADSVCITDATGSFRFTKVSYELLNINVPDTLAIMPLNFLSLQNAYVVMVSEDLTTVEIDVLPSSPRTLSITQDTTGRALLFWVVGNELPDRAQRLDLTSGMLDRGAPFTWTLPPGRYEFMSMTRGVTCSPERFTIDVAPSTPPDTVRVQARTSIPARAFSVAAITLVEHEDGTIDWAPNEQARLSDWNTGSAAFDLQGDPMSVVYRSGLGATAQYNFAPVWDTTSFVDAVYNSTFAAGFFDNLRTFVKRARQFPLAARPYTLNVLQHTFIPIASGTRAVTAASTGPAHIALPFPFPYGGVAHDSVWIYANGFISLGASAFEIGSFAPTSPYRCDGLIGALGADIDLSDSLQPGEVFVDIRGTAPERELVVEWRNVRIYALTDSGQYVPSGSFTMQTILHEGTATIDVVYGPMAFTSPADNADVQIGLRGKDDLDLRIVQFADIKTPSWSNVVTRTSKPVTTMNLRNDSKPTEGLTYRFSLTETSVPEIGPVSHDLAVMPNPASRHVVVSWPSASERPYRIDMVDGMGRPVLSSITSETSTDVTFNVASLADGAYRIVAHCLHSCIAVPCIVQR